MYLTEGPCITQDVILILHINQQPPFSHRHNHLHQQRHIQAGSVKTQAGMLSRGWGGTESPPEDKDCRGHLQTGHCCRWKVKETSQTCVPILLGQVRGCALPIPAQGCHLLAESGLAETEPLKGLGVVCAGLVRERIRKAKCESPFHLARCFSYGTLRRG